MHFASLPKSIGALGSVPASIGAPLHRIAVAVRGYVATDQPGRWCAVCVFAPWLMCRAVVHQDAGIAAFAALLFSWDLYWLACKPLHFSC